MGTLLRVCRALDLPVGHLFDGASTPLVRGGERTPIAFGGSGVSEFRLTPADETRVMLLLSEIAPGGGSGDEAYSLGAEAEVAHVVEGSLHIEVGGARHLLSAGVHADVRRERAGTAGTTRRPPCRRGCCGSSLRRSTSRFASGKHGDDGGAALRPAGRVRRPALHGHPHVRAAAHRRTWRTLDVAVLGVPFDTATSFRTGARFGPAAIRDQSQLLRP